MQLVSRHGRVGAPVQTRACAAASSVRLASGERDPPLAHPGGRQDAAHCASLSLYVLYIIYFTHRWERRPQLMRTRVDRDDTKTCGVYEGTINHTAF